MDIYIPKQIYNFIPWFCIILGTIFLLLPKELVQMICTTYLYGYGLIIIVKRNQYKQHRFIKIDKIKRDS